MGRPGDIFGQFREACYQNVLDTCFVNVPRMCFKFRSGYGR